MQSLEPFLTLTLADQLSRTDPAFFATKSYRNNCKRPNWTGQWGGQSINRPKTRLDQNVNGSLLNYSPCDQVGLFLKRLDDKFYHKRSPNIWSLLKTSRFKKKLLWLLLGNFYSIIVGDSWVHGGFSFPMLDLCRVAAMSRNFNLLSTLLDNVTRRAVEYLTERSMIEKSRF